MGVGDNLRKSGAAFGIVELFNSIVMDGLVPARGTASRHSGSGFGPPGNAQLGSPAEPYMTINDLFSNVGAESPIGSQVSMAVYHALHQFANQLTRVRNASYSLYVTPYFVFGYRYDVQAVALTAFLPELARAFELTQMPYQTLSLSVPASTDNTLRNATLVAFLTELRNKVNEIRQNPGVMPYSIFVACHSSCHASCHGSRSRR